MDIKNDFNKAMEERSKRMIADDLYPGCFLWNLAGYVLMLQAIKDLKIKTVSFSGFKKSVVFLSKIPIINNYKFIIFLSNIINLKNHFIRWHKVGDHKLYIRSTPKMHDIVRNYQILKEYEPETTKLVKDVVKEGMTCVDIGASIGYFSLLFAKCVGKK